MDTAVAGSGLRKQPEKNEERRAGGEARDEDERTTGGYFLAESGFAQVLRPNGR
jgi:hypothetical protein